MLRGEKICVVAVFLMVFHCSEILGEPSCVFSTDVTPNGRLPDVDQYDDLYPEDQPNVGSGEVIRCESPTLTPNTTTNETWMIPMTKEAPSSPNSTTTEMLMITTKEDEVLYFGRGGSGTYRHCHGFVILTGIAYFVVKFVR